MNNSQKHPDLTEEQVRRQKRGALITAFIVGLFALGIFLFTLYANR